MRTSRVLIALAVFFALPLRGQDARIGVDDAVYGDRAGAPWAIGLSPAGAAWKTPN